jgi:hypothetical protein
MFILYRYSLCRPIRGRLDSESLMALKPMSSEAMTAILDAPTTPQESQYKHERSVQTSKYLRWHDQEMRCAEGRCNSPTYLTMRGVPRCWIHALEELTDIIDQLDILLGVWNASN